ncbi:MAG: hypothetical protein AAF467_18330 [Actinomycetota bacterium]
MIGRADGDLTPSGEISSFGPTRAAALTWSNPRPMKVDDVVAANEETTSSTDEVRLTAADLTEMAGSLTDALRAHPRQADRR